MSHLKIVAQNGDIIVDKDLSLGWNYLAGPLGAWLFHDGTLRLSAGVYDDDGVGLVYVKSVRWDEHEMSTGADVIGRAPLVVRPWSTGNPNHREHWFIGGVPILLRDETMPIKRERLGMWEVEGDDTPGDGGMNRIAPIPLIPADPYGSHARTMARMALDCLSRETGLPMDPARVELEGYYALDGNWNKNTTIKRFVEPMTLTSGDDRRVPKRWNQGTCTYEQRFLGFGSGMYSGYQPFNGQHRGRALMSVQVLAECYDDECAKLDASVLAHDALYAHPKWDLPPVSGQGSAFYGRREASWAMMAFRSLQDQSPLQSAGKALVAAQTGAGCVMRCRQGEPESQGFSPDAWVASAAVPTPLPLNVDAEQSMERWLKDAAHATAGNWRQVHQSVQRFYEDPSIFTRSLPAKLGYVPKFLGVGVKNGAAFDRVTIGAGKGDFAPLIGLGLAACHTLHQGKYPRAEIGWMMQIGTPTMGKATTIKDMLQRLKSDQGGQYQTPAAIQAFEMVVKS
jgi:hypothetical protein